MIEFIECPVHEINVAKISQMAADELAIEHGCPMHNEELRARPAVSELTLEERATELLEMAGPLYHGLDLLWARMDALAGRSLFTHERGQLEPVAEEIRDLT